MLSERLLKYAILCFVPWALQGNFMGNLLMTDRLREVWGEWLEEGYLF